MVLGAIQLILVMFTTPSNFVVTFYVKNIVKTKMLGSLHFMALIEYRWNGIDLPHDEETPIIRHYTPEDLMHQDGLIVIHKGYEEQHE